MRSSATAPGRCWPRRCRPRSRPTSRRMPGRATSAAGGGGARKGPTPRGRTMTGGGRGPVVRNGAHQPRQIMTAAGAVPVRAPRVNDKRIEEVTGERKRFSSAILPAWSRKSPRVAEVLPLLYLHGLSSSDFAPALEQFLGTGHGLSAASITRLTSQWQDEARAFADRSLAGPDYVYLWVDGIHLKVRLAQDKVCLLVMIGVRADGTKELVALTDGFRESAESWADLLRNCKRRGMRAPVLAVGDGALGF